MTTPAASSKLKRATALPPEERRSTIVAAALPLLLEFGDRVTTRQIAEAAGIAEGTIFRVFADKDEIIVAVIEAVLDPAPLDAALAAIPTDLGFDETLVAAAAIMQQRVLNTWRLISAVGTRFHDTTRRPMAESDALTRVFENHRDRISLEPAAAARLLRAFTLTTTHPMMVDEPKSPAELVHLFLHGVSTNRAGDRAGE